MISRARRKVKEVRKEERKRVTSRPEDGCGAKKGKE